MFTMFPELSFSHRMGLWWSCFWRQFLGTIPIWLVTAIVAFAVYAFSTRGTSPLATQPVSTMIGMIFAGAVLLIVVSLLCVPIIGYMVRRGFRAWELTVPVQYSFSQATMLGLTTWGWTAVISVATSLLKLVATPLLGGPSAGVLIVLQIIVLLLDWAGAIYIVLPRQSRRLRLQAGETVTA